MYDAVEDLDDDFLDLSCLAQEDCVRQMVRDSPTGCLYCALGDLDDEED